MGVEAEGRELEGKKGQIEHDFGGEKGIQSGLKAPLLPQEQLERKH